MEMTQIENLNFTEINCDFRELLRKHSNDKEILRAKHLENALETFACLCNPDDEDYEYEKALAANIYNAWGELCELYAEESLEETCNWFFGAAREEAASDEENNPWDVFIAQKGLF